MKKRHIFADRVDAGRALAAMLNGYRNRSDVVVLGLARGGVPVAAEVAAALSAPLGVMVVRKIGTPGRAELAVGAVGPDESVWLDDDLIVRLRVGSADVEQVIGQEIAELRRRIECYPATDLDLTDKTVILVDDGLATGYTMRAAIGAAKNAAASAVVVAVPVGSAPAVAALRIKVDELVVVACPSNFYAVGQWYRDFRPTTDDEVCRCVQAAAQP